MIFCFRFVIVGFAAIVHVLLFSLLLFSFVNTSGFATRPTCLCRILRSASLPNITLCNLLHHSVASKLWDELPQWLAYQVAAAADAVVIHSLQHSWLHSAQLHITVGRTIQLSVRELVNSWCEHSHYDIMLVFVLYTEQKSKKTSMAWFSKIGVIFRKRTQLFATTGIVTVIGACLYPQTLGLRYYKRVMAHYKDGTILPVDSETQQIIDQVCYFLL